MSVREYVGARYVPLFATPLAWDSQRTYEPLTIVLYGGNSYTSRQFVPAGITIDNEEFWALTGNYNAQIEQYRQEVNQFTEDFTEIADEVVAELAKTPRIKYDTVINNANIDDFTECGSFAFNIANAKKFKYDGQYYESWMTPIQASRKLVLPFNENVITNPIETAYLDVVDVNGTIYQRLRMFDKEYIRKKGATDWLDWNIITESVPENNCDSRTINALLRVAYTYVDERMPYYNQNGIFYTVTRPNGETLECNIGTAHEGIDCVTLMMLTMMGVPYAYSRYNTEYADNVQGIAGYCFDPCRYNNSFRRTSNLSYSNQVAEWMRDNGYGYTPINIRDLRPGDLCFFGNTSTHPDNFKGIHHCAIYIGHGRDGAEMYTTSGVVPTWLFIEATGEPGSEDSAQVRTRTVSGMSNLVYAARVPYGFNGTVGNVPELVEGYAGTYSGTRNAITMPKPIKFGHLLTVEFEGMLTAEDAWFNLGNRTAGQSSIILSTSTAHSNSKSVNQWLYHTMHGLSSHGDVIQTDEFNVYKASAAPGAGYIRNLRYTDGIACELDEPDGMYYISTGADIESIMSEIFTSNIMTGSIYSHNIVQPFSLEGFWNYVVDRNYSSGGGRIVCTNYALEQMNIIVFRFSNWTYTEHYTYTIDYRQDSTE